MRQVSHTSSGQVFPPTVWLRRIYTNHIFITWSTLNVLWTQHTIYNKVIYYHNNVFIWAISSRWGKNICLCRKQTTSICDTFSRWLLLPTMLKYSSFENVWCDDGAKYVFSQQFFFQTLTFVKIDFCGNQIILKKSLIIIFHVFWIACSILSRAKLPITKSVTRENWVLSRGQHGSGINLSSRIEAS